jgi:hypothetical protein
VKKIVFFIACVSLLVSPVYAKGKKKGHHKGKGKTEAVSSKDTDLKAVVDVNKFSSEEKGLITQFFQAYWGEEAEASGRAANLPPGLQKKVARGKALPPGWQKKLNPGEVMDDDVFKVAVELPDELKKKLPKQADDTMLIRVEGKVVRVLKATKEILDVFDIGL